MVYYTITPAHLWGVPLKEKNICVQPGLINNNDNWSIKVEHQSFNKITYFGWSSSKIWHLHFLLILFLPTVVHLYKPVKIRWQRCVCWWLSHTDKSAMITNQWWDRLVMGLKRKWQQLKCTNEHCFRNWVWILCIFFECWCLALFSYPTVPALLFNISLTSTWTWYDHKLPNETTGDFLAWLHSAILHLVESLC